MRLYGKQKPATREPSTKAVRMAARVWSSPDVEVRFIDEAHGHGMFALRQLSAGTRLFQEYPLVAIRHQKNRKVGPSCEHCFRFLGPIEAQMRALLEKRAAKCEAIPPACEDASLPSLPALRELRAQRRRLALAVVELGLGLLKMLLERLALLAQRIQLLRVRDRRSARPEVPAPPGSPSLLLPRWATSSWARGEASRSRRGASARGASTTACAPSASPSRRSRRSATA